MSLTNFRGYQVIVASSYADDICTNLVPNGTGKKSLFDKPGLRNYNLEFLQKLGFVHCSNLQWGACHIGHLIDNMCKIIILL